MVARAVDLGVELCGIWLRTPLIPAAGTLGSEALGAAERIYGAMLPKTVTPSSREGNPPPRIAGTAAGMINSIGLQNSGVERFLEELDAFEVGLPLIVSVAGETAAEFTALCERMATDGRVSAVELNLSCPNTERGGISFCASPEAVGEVVAACREVLPGKPLLAKLTFDGALRNAVEAEESGADALTLINTVPAIAVDVHAFKGGERDVFLRGGLSGPAIKPIALRAVYEVSRVVKIPVVGCGGVARGTDVAEFMLAGASAVQVGSGRYYRDAAEILGEFVAYLQEIGMNARELADRVRA